MYSEKVTPSIAVIGTGHWGKNLVRNFNSLEALHTLCDSNRQTLHAIAEDYVGIHTVNAYEDVLANPEITGIAIATPAATHAPMVRAALEADKDVYVEKPLALSEAEGQALIELARTRERILMVGHLLWYHPAVLTLKQLISEGELGRIQYIYSNRLNMGKLRREENVLWSFAPHDVSVVLGLLGDMPESVHAQGGSFLHQHVADTTVSLLEFASGARAPIFVSWLHPFKEQKLVVVGNHKMAVFDDTVPWEQKLQLYPHSVAWNSSIPVAKKREVEYIELEQTEPLRAECRQFLDCIQTRKPPRTDGEEALRVLKVLNACQRSLERGGSLTVLEQKTEKDYFAHETAVIDSGTSIGEGAKIWHFSHVLAGSVIGAQCTIGQNVVIGPDVTVGHGCKIQNNVSLYQGVVLEDAVFCGPSCVFTNVENPRAHVSRKHAFQQTLSTSWRNNWC